VLIAGPLRASLDGARTEGPFRLRSLAIVGSTGVVCVLLLLGVSWLLVVVLVGTVGAVVRSLHRRRVRRTTTKRRGRVLGACEGLAADLAAGISPHQALRTMAEEWPELRVVADAAALGADVPTAFRTASDLPGAGMLRLAAAAWDVAHRSGAGLADAVGHAADTVRAEQETARVVATELAAATATARLLGFLPLGVLVLGRGMGGDPFGFLIRTAAGHVCLALGLGLSWAGSVWLERIADSVERA
jgi:tight adherence protein B